MRTSLNKIQEIENFLFQKLRGGDLLVFEAKIILEPKLKDEIQIQKEAYELIRSYGRKMLKAEIKAAENKVFEEADFNYKIKRLFTKKT